MIKQFITVVGFVATSVVIAGSPNLLESLKEQERINYFPGPAVMLMNDKHDDPITLRAKMLPSYSEDTGTGYIYPKEPLGHENGRHSDK